MQHFIRKAKDNFKILYYSKEKQNRKNKDDP